MMSPSRNEVTGLLLDWSKGDKAALDNLMSLVYEELLRLAHYHMGRERPGHTLIDRQIRTSRSDAITTTDSTGQPS